MPKVLAIVPVSRWLVCIGNRAGFVSSQLYWACLSKGFTAFLRVRRLPGPCPPAPLECEASPTMKRQWVPRVSPMTAGILHVGCAAQHARSGVEAGSVIKAMNKELLITHFNPIKPASNE